MLVQNRFFRFITLNAIYIVNTALGKILCYASTLTLHFILYNTLALILFIFQFGTVAVLWFMNHSNVFIKFSGCFLKDPVLTENKRIPNLLWAVVKLREK